MFKIMQREINITLEHTERIESEYKVSSEYSGSTLPTMSLDIYDDYDDVKYY